MSDIYDAAHCVLHHMVLINNGDYEYEYRNLVKWEGE